MQVNLGDTMPDGQLWTVTVKKTIERDEIANALKLQRISSSIIRVKKTCTAGKKKQI